MKDFLNRTAEIEDRLRHFQNLMPHQVQNMLLLASPYDSFILKEEGHLNEVFDNEFIELNLRHVPGMKQVTTGSEALLELDRESYDLLITTSHVGDMSLSALVARVKEQHPGIAVVLLAFDERELPWIGDLARSLDQVFVWHGDFRILVAIVKYVEDRWNVEADVNVAGVSVILLIEDSVRYYSSFLPNLYAELFKQSASVVAEGVNLTHKMMRMRARPKIILCTSYEEAEAYFLKYRDNLLGLLSDLDFPRHGASDPNAGLDFARMVRAHLPSLPIMLQTRDAAYLPRGEEVGADTVLKGSPHLLRELRRFMLVKFGFGDFVFRLDDGTEVTKAENLRMMEKVLAEVPEEAILHHARLNDFSTWLRARTEFVLAEKVRRPQVADFASVGEMREFLIRSIQEFRRERLASVVTSFDRRSFDSMVGFAKIGSGSLGGKARGLAFARELLYNHKILNRYPGVRVLVPAGVVLATDIFDKFVEENGLRDMALAEEQDAAIELAFLQARFPKNLLGDLYRFLDFTNTPLAVRSSSLLEDSQNQPFAGVYQTIFCANNHPDHRVRRREVVWAVKRVFASVYAGRAKAYIRGSPFRLEEEKMAVIVQRLGGAVHGPRFYPTVAGVARSHNFYPAPPMEARDGVATTALGLGQTVVEGGNAVRFCPRYPHRIMDCGSPNDLLDNAQTTFYALDLSGRVENGSPDVEYPMCRYTLETAQEDGTLGAVASVYSPENDAVYDGMSREGIPFVSMAPLLKHDLFPLAEILHDILEIGERGLNAPVEIEFAVNLFPPPGEPKEFYFLQMRPLVVAQETGHLNFGSFPRTALLCSSRRVLGTGRVEGLHDLVVVDRDRFDPACSQEVAAEVARLNSKLSADNHPYVLIGTGRWGSSEPWLGIPVRWEQIAGARVIVESDFRGKRVAPSQGSHFFHNLTAALVGYFTVNTEEDGFVDWDWLRELPAVEEGRFVRHVRLEEPLSVIVDGREGRGIILKPGIDGNGHPAARS